MYESGAVDNNWLLVAKQPQYNAEEWKMKIFKNKETEESTNNKSRFDEGKYENESDGKSRNDFFLLLISAFIQL